MHEKFLSYLWRYRRFDLQDLYSTEGEAIEIIHPGVLNTDSGPDFSQAKIRIGDTLWAGNVEIHVLASHWIAHKHTRDKAYDNTILHVVYQEDTPICNTYGVRIPCLVLDGRIADGVYSKYLNLEGQNNEIPCAQFLQDVPAIIWHQWLDRLLIERLEAKTDILKKNLAFAENRWDEAFYQALARAFGQHVNAEPFAALARSIPTQILAKHSTQLFQIEALLFGQAGMLATQYQDAYPESLRKEYHFLRQKYQLEPLDVVQWKYFRLRPVAFPTIRIAQFAALVQSGAHMFSRVIEATSVREIALIFRAEASAYWKNHYRFDEESAKSCSKPISKDLIQLIMVNTVLPFWFLYGKERATPDQVQKALAFYESLPAEKNHILTTWANVGKPTKQAHEAQACIQLFNEYCTKKRCTECAIGVQILK